MLEKLVYSWAFEGVPPFETIQKLREDYAYDEISIFTRDGLFETMKGREYIKIMDALQGYVPEAEMTFEFSPGLRELHVDYIFQGEVKPRVIFRIVDGKVEEVPPFIQPQAKVDTSPQLP